MEEKIVKEEGEKEIEYLNRSEKMVIEKKSEKKEVV